MEFEWDPKKTASNIRKHEVSFQETATVFGDPLAITFDDPDRSAEESRQITFGLSLQNRSLVVCHAERAGRRRIVSTRLMSRTERKVYEEG